MTSRGVLIVFRVIAAVEAFTWAGLLVGMFFKRVLKYGELGVQVFGPLHGAAFIAYVLIAVLAWWKLRWTPWTGLLALGASIPPLFTVLFERVASATGHIDRSEPTGPDRPVGAAEPSAPVH